MRVSPVNTRFADKYIKDSQQLMQNTNYINIQMSKANAQLSFLKMFHP